MQICKRRDLHVIVVVNEVFGFLQARPSRLSFNDIIKRIAATPEEDLTFISKKVHTVGSVPLPC